MNRQTQWLFEAPLTLEVKDEDAPDPQQSQKSLEAILRALKLNPVGGYVKGTSARKQLEEAFESVPLCFAVELSNQLKKGGSQMGRLFRYRLHPDTQAAMLKLLEKKKDECDLLILNIQQEQKRLLEKECASFKNKLRVMDSNIEKVCKLQGEDSDSCQELKFKALEIREKISEKFRRFDSHCP